MKPKPFRHERPPTACPDAVAESCTIELQGIAVTCRLDASKGAGDLQWFERIATPSRFFVRFHLPDQAAAALKVLLTGCFDSLQIPAECVTPVPDRVMSALPHADRIERRWIRGRLADRATWELVSRVPLSTQQTERTSLRTFESQEGPEGPGYHTITLGFSDGRRIRFIPDELAEPCWFCTGYGAPVVTLLKTLTIENASTSHL